MSVERMWINQPSRLQPLHQLHGTNILAEIGKMDKVRIYFLRGQVISMDASLLYLNYGWKDED